MTIAIKGLLFAVLITLMAAVFPANIMTLLNVPILSIQSTLQGAADFISQLCNFGDIFLLEGTSMAMIKGVVLVFYFYVLFKIFYPVVKLIFY